MEGNAVSRFFDEMTEEQLGAIRARLDEPPPLIALAGRNHGVTPLVEYLALLREDRIMLVEEINRLRAELTGTVPPQVSE
jgi:hypothetical protein